MQTFFFSRFVFVLRTITVRCEPEPIASGSREEEAPSGIYDTLDPRMSSAVMSDNPTSSYLNPEFLDESSEGLSPDGIITNYG